MSVPDDKNASFKDDTISQKAYTIGGVPILFPYKAYPSQITMMDKIIKCLNKKHNCLLESPTGSGKSLALLCSTLAWVKKTGKEIRQMEQLLEKHLSATGVTILDNNGSSSSNFSKNDFYEKYAYNTTNNVKKSETPYESFDINKSFKDNVKCCDTNFVCDVNPNVTSGMKLHSANQIKFNSVDDNIKKRGIVYIDEINDDDDQDDFQPVKKSKYFSVTQEHQESIVLKDSSFVAESSVSKFCSREDIPSSQGSENPNNINTHSTIFTDAKKLSESAKTNTLPTKLPKIYFGTRTHKQIAQIIRELKKTPYKDVKMTILSSRERTCIHPVNSKSRNKNEGCDELINKENGPSCNYFKNVRRLCYSHPTEISSAFDLEDFVRVCRRKQICPYFGARELLQNSEIVFCPYNYLVDPMIRSALNISLKGNIIIMDEAHNIEDSAREAANRNISISDLQESIADVLQIGQLNHEDNECYMHLAKVLENLKKWLENLDELNDYVSFDSSAKVWSGDDMIAVLDYVGLGPDTFPVFQNMYIKIQREENDAEKTKVVESDLPKLSGHTHICLKGLSETLNYMYKENLHFVPDFRLVVMKSKVASNETSLVPASQASKRKSFSFNSFEKTINFWCLNPAVVFSDFRGVVHSLIVASGTLSPLASFQSELGMPFQITLEANHVISVEQMWVGTIGRGPNNSALNGTFHSASTFTFQDDIGNVVLEVCSVIPYGILCFLPSYGMLDKLINRWQITGLWDKLLSKKHVLCEPRGANESFQQIIQEFYDAVRDSESNIYSDVNGALLLAVCRGKVSEGLDFADNNARAVITVGIPFPNIKDAQVDLKKKYNDRYSSQRPIVTGSEWYEMQAFRALNQALGRCIRHKNDYGALIIVDERFQKYNRYIAALSKWIRREIKHYSTFNEAISSLNCFAEKMGLKNNLKS